MDFIAFTKKDKKKKNILSIKKTQINLTTQN